MEKSKNQQSENENNVAPWRAELARKAQKEGHIQCLELAGIMAVYESYIEILPFLRKKFIPPRVYIVSSNDDLPMWQGRRDYWMHLIRRWAGLEADSTKKNLPGIDYLNCYRRDKIASKFMLLDRDKIKPEYLDHYINLDDFANYLKDIEYIYQIKLPPPKLLYPSQDKPLQQNIQDDKKVFPCKLGTKWTDVEITLVSYEFVEIKTPQGKDSFHFKEIGMLKGSTLDKPSDLWTLLGVFCKYSGRIDSTSSTYGFKNLSKSISDLNRKLKDVFGINEGFCHRYNKKDGWIAKCIFNDNTSRT